jgi:hypothetical protein
MAKKDIGVPTPNTPNWWLTTEQMKKYRGPNNWKRNWEERFLNKKSIDQQESS